MSIKTDSELVSMPRWLYEWLIDTAKEHRAQNEWNRNSSESDRNLLCAQWHLANELLYGVYRGGPKPLHK